MGKMSWIHHLATNQNEADLIDLLRSYKWSRKAAEIGAKEFIKAANEVEEDKEIRTIKFKDGKKQEDE